MIKLDLIDTEIKMQIKTDGHTDVRTDGRTEVYLHAKRERESQFINV